MGTTKHRINVLPRKAMLDEVAETRKEWVDKAEPEIEWWDRPYVGGTRLHARFQLTY